MSPIHQEILGYIAEGFTNKEIAIKMKMAERTIDSYRHQILQKTGAINAPNLVAYGFRTGLLK